MRNVEALFNEFRNSNSHPALAENSNAHSASTRESVNSTYKRTCGPTNENHIHISFIQELVKKKFSFRLLAARPLAIHSDGL